MTSLFRRSDTTDPEGSLQKYSIRRLEPSIQKFLKVIEIDLNRLERHRTNFEKFNRLQDWQGLNRELINASRTLQQIKANLREIEKTREQIVDDDLDEFDSQIEEVKQRALVSVGEFLEIYTHIEVKKVTKYGEDGCVLDSSESPGYLEPQLEGDINTLMLSDCDDLILTDQRLHLHAVPDNSEASESLENLKDSLLELNDLIHNFASVVHHQKEAVDRIENNIDSAHGDVQQGVMNIGAAAKLKKAMFPIAGAMIGGIVGGPVGFVAGIKLGAMAAVGGGIVGFASGAIIKKQQNKKIDTELQDLSNSQPQSISEPD